MSDDSVCFDVIQATSSEDDHPVSGSTVLLLACSEMLRQKWKYNPVTKRIQHLSSDLCLSLESSSLKHVILETCSTDSEESRQKWNLVPIEWNKTIHENTV